MNVEQNQFRSSAAWINAFYYSSFQHIKTLVYCDGPQIFLAENSFDTQYLCLLVECADEFDKYLCVAISDERLREFYDGHIDLRKIFAEPERNELYYANIPDNFDLNIQMSPLPYNSIPEKWLPESGFTMDIANTNEDRENHVNTINTEKLS